MENCKIAIKLFILFRYLLWKHSNCKPACILFLNEIIVHSMAVDKYRTRMGCNHNAECTDKFINKLQSLPMHKNNNNR